jgi:hypothetical protein
LDSVAVLTVAKFAAVQLYHINPELLHSGVRDL